jgi:PleD family two-component response regulator
MSERGALDRLVDLVARLADRSAKVAYGGQRAAAWAAGGTYLTIAYRLVDRNGAEYSSEAGPRRTPEEVTAMSTQPLVLVADDEQRITKLVSMALTDEGFRVVTAAGGEEALAKAEEVRPDIVLLDIVMPDMDGIEVMRQLRERRSVPVILLTAKGSAGDKAKGLDLGADDYIAKPFHLDELAARVRAVLRRASGVAAGTECCASTT